MVNASPAVSSEARESLRRLVASVTMARAPRVQGVVAFIVDRILAGQADGINEESIGQAVFGRPEGYSRADDNIVRVTIRHARARMEEFYSTEGSEELWVLDIPKGKYLPVLRQREAAFTGQPDAPDPAGAGSPVSDPASPKAVRPIPWLWLVGGVLVFYNLTLGVLLYRRPPAVPPPPPDGLIQSLFSSSGLRLSIVPADANLQLYRIIFQKTVPLREYLDRSYIRPEATASNPLSQGAWAFIKSTSETTIASSLVALRLQQSILPSKLRIRHPHEFTMRDIQQENVVLLGGPWINPWGQLFEDRLNFRLMPLKADASQSEVRNAHPQNGEPEVFRVHSDGALSVGYARLAFLPNLSDTGKVILVGATDAGSIEAGGEFLAGRTGLLELLDRFHVEDAKALPFFELVLEVRSVNLTPREVRVVAARRIEHPR